MQNTLEHFYDTLNLGATEKVLCSYFHYVFNFLENENHLMTFIRFYNYMKLPYFISKKFFNILSNKTNCITRENFISFFITFYIGNDFQKSFMIFNFLDINRKKQINIHDVKIIFSHLYSKSGYGNLIEGTQIILEFFGEKQELSFNEYNKKIKKTNSDLFFIFFYFFIQYKPFETCSLQFFEENVLKTIPEKNESNSSFKDLFPPSNELLSFLFCDNFNELEELNKFENSLSVMVEKIEKYKINKKGFNEEEKTLKKRTSEILHTTPRPLYETEFIFIDESNQRRNSKLVLSSVKDVKEIQNILINNTFTFFIHDEEGQELKMVIVGNDMYIFTNLKDNNHFKYLLPLKDFSTEISKSNKKKINLFSALTNKIQVFSFYCDTEEEAVEIYDVISKKTNFIPVSDKFFINSVMNPGELSKIIEGKAEISLEKVAIRILPKDYKLSEEEFYKIRQEQDILNFIKVNPNENIICIKEIFESINAIYLVQEYIESSNLLSFVRKSPRIYVSEIKEICDQIVSGMRHYSSYGIVHQDLKPGNILVLNNKQNLKIKIIDFCFASVACKNEKIEGIFGTLPFVAPEILKEVPFDSKVDVWSFGCILFYISYKFNLFCEERTKSELKNAIINDVIVLPKRGKNNIVIPQKIKDLIVLCLERNAANRPDISDLSKIIKQI